MATPEQNWTDINEDDKMGIETEKFKAYITRGNSFVLDDKQPNANNPGKCLSASAILQGPELYRALEIAKQSFEMPFNRVMDAMMNAGISLVIK